jgi:hypothetical protein
MKRGSTVFLRLVVMLIGVIMFGLCVIALPAGITSDNTGFYRPILLGLYIPAIPFFYALFQTLKLLNYIDKNKAFSESSVNALGNIKKCAVLISGLFILGMPYIFSVADRDDAPGVAAIGFLIIGASIVIAVFAAVLQMLMISGMALKSENDLTV